MAPRHIASVEIEGLAAVSKIRAGKNDSRQFVDKSDSSTVERRSTKQVSDTTEGAFGGVRNVTRGGGQVGIVRAVQTRYARPRDVSKGDVIMAVRHGEVVHKFRAKSAGEMGGKTQARSNEIVFDGREAVVGRRPLRAEDLCFPGVMDVADINLLIRREIVVETNEILTPRCKRRDGGRIAMGIRGSSHGFRSGDGRSAAVSRVGEGN